MTRVRLLDAEDLPEDDRDVLERPINLYRAFAHLPELARRYREMGRWLRFEGSLDPRLRELAVLEVGYVTGAPYEWSHHLAIGREFGVTDQDVAALIADPEQLESSADGPFGRAERNVLRFARDLTTDGRVTDSLWKDVEDLLGVDQVVELSALVGFYNMTIRFLAALEVDVEESYQQELERFPLPT